MNFYKRHLGDYAKDTGHLSMLEHGAYTLLLDRYYATEQPIPAAEVHRVCRARGRDEKAAVDAVLDEFFTLEDGAWCNKRADDELAVAQESGEEREAKLENERERQRRHRQERKHLFEQLRGLAIVPAWDTKTEALRSMLVTATATGLQRDGSRPVTPPVTRTATANQTPDSNNQTPNTPHIPPKRKRDKPVEVTLAEWLDALKTSGGSAVPSTDAVFGYARQIGLPPEFLHLAWADFKARYTADPVKGQRQKTYTDWRAVFRKAVKEGWLKLWYLDGQHYALTTAGMQAQRALQAAQAERQPGELDEVPA